MFPKMLDQYQIQLTRMLESERYGEAKELLRFLMQCQGEDQRHYEEWSNLLSWLDMAFPGESGAREGEGYGLEADEEENEEQFRKQAIVPTQHDSAYIEQVLYIMQNHPVVDQQILALERAAHLNDPVVDETIVSWITKGELHPALQFKALQCLRRRGVTGRIVIERLGERTDLEIERTPLSMSDFPDVVIKIVERVESVTEVIDSTMPHFARELWKESLQCFYGTSAYDLVTMDDDETVDCFAGALHQTLELSIYGRSEDESVRDTYGITDALRFRYEQACRILRQASMFIDNRDGS
ncbi:hypothetical protein FHS18_001935 [Paenibacillus phyllosphaerae]|uniref:Uncharacterized protein n=1 Tax=Paenibacillus phyllosphaerae TaxID=274593 RepID=A0A7W5FMA5_9BACL|nr:hypothetical protein [Paenibacillus phyllosphaerae]MBB3109872.1 hypothetical protein [Paenibacillus phyllosphaerae]